MNIIDFIREFSLKVNFCCVSCIYLWEIKKGEYIMGVNEIIAKELARSINPIQKYLRLQVRYTVNFILCEKFEDIYYGWKSISDIFIEVIDCVSNLFSEKFSNNQISVYLFPESLSFHGAFM